jgi:hypothetical protein
MAAELEATSSEGTEPVEPVQMKGGSITANEVHATGAINQVNATEVNFKDGGIFLMQAGSVDLNDSGAFLISTQKASVADSGMAVVLSDQVDMAQSRSNIVIARDVKADHVQAKVFLARTVNGEVETLLDGPRTALAGLFAGLGLGLVITLARLLFRKSRL